MDFKNAFQKLIRNRLAHGYIFFGHESADERFSFARELANFLENQKWAIADRILNDAQIVDARNDSGIDTARSASQFLWQKPAVSSKRTLIINNADNLTLPAQNAILKISEEPPQHALIVLLVKSPEVLLPALQSRFQKIFFPKVSDSKFPISSEAKNFLKAPAAKRKEFIKELIENEKDLGEFVAGIIAELQKDKMKNWKTLKELLGRWTAINQYNVNKRLQLEAALLELR